MSKRIDLSDFLKDPSTASSKRNTNKRDKFEDLREQKLPSGFVRCTQCSGSGSHVHTVSHSVPLSDKQEEILFKLGKEPVGIQSSHEQVKCQKCNGTGSYLIPDKVQARRVVQWWSRYRCTTCGRRYEAPTFVNQITIEHHVFAPIIRLGVHSGWRFKEVLFRPTHSVHGMTLPFETRYHDVDIVNCRHCTVHELTICLPYQEAS